MIVSRACRIGLLAALFSVGLPCLLYGVATSLVLADGEFSSRSPRQDGTVGGSAFSYEVIESDRWPPAAAADMREISLTEWNTWLEQLTAQRLPPASLDSWQWTARFDEVAQSLSGEFRLRISRRDEEQAKPLLLPLGEFSAAIKSSESGPEGRHARWEESDEHAAAPAILGNQANGQLAILVERSGTAVFTATQRAQESNGYIGPQGFSFVLDLPTSPSRSIQLELPAGYQPKLDSRHGLAVRGHTDDRDANAGESFVSWDLRLNAAGPVVLAIEKSPSDSRDPTTVPAIRHEETTYQASGNELLARTRWQLELPQPYARILQLHVPASAQVIGVTANGTRLNWKNAEQQSSPGRQILEIDTTGVPVAGDTAGEMDLEVTTLASLRFGSLMTLPRMTLPEFRWTSGVARIEVVPPLAFADVQFADAQCRAGLSNGQLEFDLYSADAQLSLAVTSPERRQIVSQVTRLHKQGDQLVAASLLKFSQIDLSAGEIELSLTPGWELTDVSLAGMESLSELSALEWSIEAAGDDQSSQLIVSLPARTYITSELILHVAAHRLEQGATSLAAADLLPVSLAGANVAEDSLLLADDASPNALQFDGRSKPVENSFWQEVPAFAFERSDLHFDLIGTDANTRLTSLPKASPQQVQVRVNAEFSAREVRERFHFGELAGVADGELLIFVTEPREDAAWHWADATGNALNAEKLSRQEMLTRGLPPTGELWKVSWPETPPTEIIAERTTTISSPLQRIGLAVVLDSPAHVSGLVAVKARRVKIVDAKTNAGSADGDFVSALWPVAEDFDANSALAVKRFRYQPDQLLAADGAGTAVQAELGSSSAPTSNATSSRERQPLIWKATLDWSLQETGKSICSVMLAVERNGADRLQFRLPDNARLLDANVSAEPLEWSETNGVYSVPLAAHLSYFPLQLTFAHDGQAIGLIGNVSPPWPEFESSVLQRSATLRLPQGLRLAHGTLPDAQPTLWQALASRVLGPLIADSFLPHSQVESETQAATEPMTNAGPWTALRSARSQPSLDNGSSIYPLTAAQDLSVIHTRRQATLNAIVLLLAAVAGWLAGRRGYRVSVFVAILAFAIVLAVPDALATIVIGLPVPFALGAIVGLISKNPWLSKVASKVQRRSRISRSSVSVAIVCGLGAALLASRHPQAVGAESTLWSQSSLRQDAPRSEVVYIQVDDDGAPTGQSVFATEELVASINNRIAELQMRPAGYLLLNARHRLTIAEGDARPRLGLSLTVYSMESSVVVRLPLRSEQFAEVPGSAYVMPLGQDSPLDWSDNYAQLQLKGAGVHTIELDLTVNDLGNLDETAAEIAIPPIADAMLEMSFANQRVGGRGWELQGSHAGIQRFPLAGFSVAALGPLAELHLAKTREAEAAANEIKAEVYTRLRLMNSGSRLTTRIDLEPDLNDETVDLEQLSVRIPAQASVERIEVDGRTLSGLNPAATSSAAFGVKVLNIPLSATNVPLSSPLPRSIELQLVLPPRSLIGNWQFPAVQLEEITATSELWAVTLPGDFQIRPLTSRQTSPGSTEDFITAWGQFVEINEVVRANGTNAAWNLAVVPVAGNPVCRSTTEATLRTDGCAFRFNFTVSDVGDRPTFLRATIPSGLSIQNVSATDATGAELLDHWQLSDGKLVLFLSAPAANPMQIEIRAEDHWDSLPEGYRPQRIHFEGLSEISSSLTLFSATDLQAEVAELAPRIPEAAQSAQPPVGTRLVGAFPLVPGVNAPRVALSEHEPPLTGRLTTRIARKDGQWQASVRMQVNPTDGVLPPVTLRVPQAWRLIGPYPRSWNVADPEFIEQSQHLRITAAVDARLGNQARPHEGTFFFVMPDESLNQFLPPQLTSPGQVEPDFAYRLIVPKAAEGIALAWQADNSELAPSETSGTREFTWDALPGEVRLAELAANDQQSAAPRISLLVATGGAYPRPCVTATYSVQPHGASHISFTLPKGSVLVRADINGLPAEVETTSAGVARVYLLSKTQPQRVGLCVLSPAAVTSPGASQPGASQLAAPQPIDINVPETVWMTGGLLSMTNTSQTARQLSQQEAAARIQSELETEALSFESSSPLAANLLARDLDRAEAQRNVNQPANGGQSVSQFWTSQSCADIHGANRQAYVFSGGQFEIALALETPASTSGTRWVFALGLLAVAVLFFPVQAQEPGFFFEYALRLRLPGIVIVAGACLLAMGAWFTGAAALFCGIVWAVIVLRLPRQAEASSDPAAS